MEENFDKEIQDAQNANPDQTSRTETTDQTNQEAAPAIDYEVKFKESAKEAQRLYHENQELLKAQQAVQEEIPEQTMENLYPGFENLDEEAQINLEAYTKAVTDKAKSEILKDPAIAYARKNFNEATWDSAFQSVLSKHPELADSKDEFKSKYFNANNVPSNIDSILGDVAKIYLFDKAKEIGAQDERTRLTRVEVERSTGGEKEIPSGRSLGDWQRMALDNPAKFAQLSKEYHSDLDTGKLKE